MQQLFSAFYQQLSRISIDFKRYLYSEIHWKNRLIAIIGSRGTGKTTMLLQYIKSNYKSDSSEVLYASLDNLWFSTHSLIHLAEEFSKQGGKALFLDEVHNYPGWSREIKNIYDTYPDMKIVFTGSSLLEVYKGEADLSRRAITYHLYGLSFREFLEYEYGIMQKTVSVDEIISNHKEFAMEIGGKIKPLVAFNEYIRYGYFPYYKEDKELYHSRLLATLNTIIELDLPATEKIDYYSVIKIKKLFAVLASMVPFTPNILQLSHDIETTRISLLNYLYYLEKAEAIMFLKKETSGIKQMSKPDKVYLGNTNYAFALGGEQTNIGSVRESFFMNQVRVKHSVEFSNLVDFRVSEKYNFEIGGKNKTKKQIVNLENAFTVVDNIEIGYGNQIPLWIFGLTY
ncbi:MAG: ATP-binding protein [Bacteroidetes bacterium]|nr:ATP-binding protein [Bacteroidota bacterium]